VKSGGGEGGQEEIVCECNKNIINVNNTKRIPPLLDMFFKQQLPVNVI
jgi:ribose 5-phosphate isomerase